MCSSKQPIFLLKLEYSGCSGLGLNRNNFYKLISHPEWAEITSSIKQVKTFKKTAKNQPQSLCENQGSPRSFLCPICYDSSTIPSLPPSEPLGFLNFTLALDIF